MNKIASYYRLSIIAACSLIFTACGGTPQNVKQEAQRFLPVSDTLNEGGWVLNEEVSDEFEGNEIDRSKWFVQGDKGDYYVWKGHAPSQFAPHNVLVEEGILKIRSQWEPSYPFAYDERYKGKNYGEHKGVKTPITTAAIISHKRFLNGYMEIRSKASDAAIASSFWLTGYESELDVYEHIGKPKASGDIKDNTWKASVHNWQPSAERPTRKFGLRRQLPFRVADDFHVYGVEWGQDVLKFFIDGELVHTVTQKEAGKDWVLTNPLEVWLDTKISSKFGLPNKSELPVDHEVDYVRIWQKPSFNVLQPAFFSFEGPILFEDQPRPLDLVPGSAKSNDYQKFWQIDDASSALLSIVGNETFSSGTRSLKYSNTSNISAKEVAAVAPRGSVNLPKGRYTFSAKVWIEPGSKMDGVGFFIENSEVDPIAFDLSSIATGEWVTLEQAFTKKRISNGKEFLRISMLEKARSSKPSIMFIDEISISR